ncbi:MAG TPA: zinc ribbon domain-containing protein [Fimbriimonadaceae bacterium]|nr:zinc ribbon domain-containing protein [Fimbriimonadaceae bacterium]
MPIFDMSCKKCGNTYEALSGVIADDSLHACPACGSSDVLKDLPRSVALPRMMDVKNMEKGEVNMILRNSRDIEKRHESIEWQDGKEPSEMKPKIPKRLY